MRDASPRTEDPLEDPTIPGDIGCQEGAFLLDISLRLGPGGGHGVRVEWRAGQPRPAEVDQNAWPLTCNGYA